MTNPATKHVDIFDCLSSWHDSQSVRGSGSPENGFPLLMPARARLQATRDLTSDEFSIRAHAVDVMRCDCVLVTEAHEIQPVLRQRHPATVPRET